MSTQTPTYTYVTTCTRCNGESWRYSNRATRAMRI